MNLQKIKSIEVITKDVPLKTQWKIALYQATTREHAIVKITTEEGVVGYGEAAPSPAFMGETGRTIELVIKKYITPVLIGCNVFDIEMIHQRMEGTIHGNGAAKAVIDMALYDIMGKILNQPVYEMLGGKERDTIPLTWVVGMKDLKGSVEEALEYIKLGYKTLKIKVGRTPEIDVELVKTIREAVGSDIALRLDANQGYDYSTALQVFSKIQKYDIESLEQPVRRWNYDGLKQLKERLQVPIMADESVSSLNDLSNILNNRAADLVNIKVGKVGGLLPSKKIAHTLETFDIHATSGSNLELSVGTAASVHFVASSPNLDLPHDLYIGSPLHTEEIAETSHIFKDGSLLVSDEPGLGVMIQENLF
jgi:o-succinylbenzoate synthase